MRCPYYRYGREPLTERHVQAIWYDRDIRPARLWSRSGTEVRVVHPGKWNLESGPDFKDAVIEVGPDHQRMKGDVEVHLSPSDWELHAHGYDPAYRNVICHVTWGCGPTPASLPVGAISIWLGRFMTEQIGFAPEQIDLGVYPFARLPATERPCHALLKTDPDLAGEVLAAAGEYRLRAKARRLGTVLSIRANEREQVIYEEVMTALGYKRNASAFRRIAELVPLERLRAEPDNAEMALVGASTFVDWDHRNLRPNNKPEMRLRAAGQLFTSRDIGVLLNAHSFIRRECRDLVAFLSRDRLMGKGRAAAILANVVVPAAIGEGRVSGPPEWLPPEDLSEPVRLTAFRMFGRDHNPSAFYAQNDMKIQGLIQIHRDYCLQVHPDCDGCALVSGLGVG